MFYHTVIGQTSTRQTLIQTIHQECELIFPDNFAICKNDYLDILKEKFNAAEIYLTVKLSGMVLVDSSSLYDRLKKELDSIEKLEPQNKNDSITWLNKLEKSYLLISVLKPSKSDSLFTKLLHSYFQLTPISFTGKNKLESFFQYQIWLLDLLENRFGKETLVYSKGKSILYYNKALSLAKRPFMEIDDERIFLKQLEQCVKIATTDSLLAYKYTDLMSRLYEIRASKAMAKYKTNLSDSLFLFIEHLFSKALFLTPNSYRVNYNLGIFYYNQAVYLINSIDFKTSTGDQEKVQKQAQELFKKAHPLIEKAKSLNDYKNE